LDNTVTLDQPLRLRTLAGPRRPQKNQSHLSFAPRRSVSDNSAHLLLISRDVAPVSAGGPAISTS
jgi:hypothetical protein